MANTITGSISNNGLGFVKATIDGITFDKIRKNSKLMPQVNGVATVSNNEVWKAGGTTSNWLPSVQSVDIDWNGAILPNANISTGGSVTINTTGELLKLINDMQQEIYTLAAAVIAIGNNQ